MTKIGHGGQSKQIKIKISQVVEGTPQKNNSDCRNKGEEGKYTVM